MSESTQALRQLQNTVEIVGTLKSINLEKKVSKKNNHYVKGNLVVESKTDGKIQETKVEVFIMKSSKLYKGIETVMREYKALDSLKADEVADRISVTGELVLNEYINAQNHLVSYNQVKGVFFNRLTPENDRPDKAIASVEVVVESFVPLLDSENLPTGDYSVNAFNVAYGPTIVELKNTIVKADLAQSFMDLYQPNSTGRITFQLNNYAEVKEVEVEVPQTQHGFGSTETVDTFEAKNYVNNIQVIGGDLPYMEPKAFTPEEIEEAKRLRSLAIQELSSSAPETPQSEPTGFGSNGNTQQPAESTEDPFSNQSVEDSLPTGLTDEDVPDF